MTWALQLQVTMSLYFPGFQDDAENGPVSERKQVEASPFQINSNAHFYGSDF